MVRGPSRQHAQAPRLQLGKGRFDVASRGEQRGADLAVVEAVAVHVDVGMALDLRLDLDLPLVLRREAGPP